MTIQTQSWESVLLSLAYEAVHPANHSEKPHIDDKLLDEAYGYCASLTALHSRSFHLASGLLPADKRRAVRALYAFCRISDDIVDSAISKQFVENAYQHGLYTDTDTIANELARWRQRTLSGTPQHDDLVAVAWAHARARYNVPHNYAVQLIDGVQRDLHQCRYSNFPELASYCYGVASTVGLMSMHIIGYDGDEAIPYAIKLGVALQITNILRDVAEDYQAGRVYLPQNELHEFGLSDEHIAQGVESGVVTDNWRAFMDFQIERNRRLYAEAMPGVQLLDPDGHFATTAAAELYRYILDDIENHDYNVFIRRSHVTRRKKIGILPRIWFKLVIKKYTA